MKGFYQWYRKHITGAIFAGLILGQDYLWQISLKLCLLRQVH